MWNLSGLVLLFVTATFVTTTATAATSDTDFSDCASNLGTLEKALYETGSNLFELNRIFFPPSERTTRFIRVEYAFLDDVTNCNVTYIWAVGEVLFLQPPTLFKLNSLFFYFPNNEFITLHLQLPIECIPLINGTDGICSCMNDSQMLDVLTQQLNIYAKFTAQDNVERSPTFARAVCAGELYDIYYSGMDDEYSYIIVAAAIVGPLSLVMLTLIFLPLEVKKYKLSRKVQRMKHKNLVSLALIGIYVTIYILILDILAVNIVRTSRHEYEPELSGRNSFNLAVTYITLVCDLLAFSLLLAVLLAIAIIKVKQFRKAETGSETKTGTGTKTESETKTETKDETESKTTNCEDLFLLLLVAPSLCIMSHFGYILLAWITEPSRSTTTLILYYFLSSYLFLVFRKSYKVGIRLHKDNHKSMKETKPPQPGLTETTVELEEFTTDNTSESSPIKLVGGSNQQDSDPIDILIFFINIPLGVPYIGVAVLFIMAVYLMPLASEDLFNYLFNVIQFMIVVISTQFAYKLLVGKEFGLKRVIKNIQNIIKKQTQYKPPPDTTNIAAVTGHFIASELLVPHINKQNGQRADTLPLDTVNKQKVDPSDTANGQERPTADPLDTVNGQEQQIVGPDATNGQEGQRADPNGKEGDPSDTTNRQEGQTVGPPDTIELADKKSIPDSVDTSDSATEQSAV